MRGKRVRVGESVGERVCELERVCERVGGSGKERGGGGESECI